MQQNHASEPFLPFPARCFWLEILCPDCGIIRARTDEEYLVMCPVCARNVIEIRHRAAGMTTQPIPEYLTVAPYTFTYTRRKHA